jgi:hypothetical protein
MEFRMIARRCFPLVLILGGCDHFGGSKLPIGTRLYEQPNHQYFGQVIGFEAAHDFHNGAPPTSAVLIEPSPKGEPVWGAVDTCKAAFDCERP